jgi:hypothetical protein
MQLTMLTRIGLLAAVGLFLVAGYFYRDSAGVRETFTGMPIRISLAGNASEVQTSEFIAKGGRSYDIEVVGRATSLNLQQHNLSWALLEHEQIVAHGEVARELGSDGDDAVIGSFRPAHDGHYKLRVDSHDSAVSPAATQADLIVIPDMGERDDIGMAAGILEFAAGICGFLGSMVLAFAVAGVVAKRRKLAQLAHGSVSR